MSAWSSPGRQMSHQLRPGSSQYWDCWRWPKYRRSVLQKYLSRICVFETGTECGACQAGPDRGWPWRREPGPGKQRPAGASMGPAPLLYRRLPPALPPAALLHLCADGQWLLPASQWPAHQPGAPPLTPLLTHKKIHSVCISSNTEKAMNASAAGMGPAPVLYRRLPPALPPAALLHLCADAQRLLPASQWAAHQPGAAPSHSTPDPHEGSFGGCLLQVTRSMLPRTCGGKGVVGEKGGGGGSLLLGWHQGVASLLSADAFQHRSVNCPQQLPASQWHQRLAH